MQLLVVEKEIKVITTKMKLLTICFAGAISIFNATDAMNWKAERENYRNLVLDRLAIKGVRSLAEFANLPNDRVTRLNPNFVSEARSAHRRLVALSEAQTLPGLLPLTWLPAALLTDLTTTNTRLTELSQAQTLSELLALDTSWLQPELVRSIRKADIKFNFNLPSSMYKNIEGIPENNTIGTQLMTIMNGGGGQPAPNDDVSKALEVLYLTIATNPHTTTDINVKINNEGQYNYFKNIVFFSSDNDQNTETYLKFLSGILIAGRKAENDFSNIKAAIMPKFLKLLKNMIA